MKERKARVEDALHATRAAVEGDLPGGGVALLRACAREAEGSSRTSWLATRSSRAPRPLTQIAANAGQDGGVIAKVMR